MHDINVFFIIVQARARSRNYTSSVAFKGGLSPMVIGLGIGMACVVFACILCALIWRGCCKGFFDNVQKVWVDSCKPEASDDKRKNDEIQLQEM